MSDREAVRALWSRVLRWIAYPTAAVLLFLLGHALGSIVFRPIARKQGYKAGYASGVYSDSTAVAWSIEDKAFKSTYSMAGIDLDEQTTDCWQMASFRFVPASSVGWHVDHFLSKDVAPIFVLYSRAIPGRWYYARSDGSLSYVDR